MSLLGAPRHPIQQDLPPWSRFRIESNGRRFVRVDARSGPLACITHTELFPHGETTAIMCSVMVRSSMLFGNDDFEGIGPAVQAYVRDSSKPSGLRRIWQQRPDLAGKKELWATHDQFAEFTPVDFVVQMPENISPDFIRVTWVSKGYSGQADFTDFVVRDFYARTFTTSVPATSGLNDYDFDYQLARDLFPVDDGTTRSGNIWAYYFGTHVARIKSGQPIDLYFSGEIIRGQWINNSLNRVPVIGFIALKCLRSKDGGADWLFSRVGQTDDPTVISGVANYNIRRPSRNAYSQFDVLAFALTPNTASADIAQTQLHHLGFDIKVTIDDSVESGTG